MKKISISTEYKPFSKRISFSLNLANPDTIDSTAMIANTMNHLNDGFLHNVGRLYITQTVINSSDNGKRTTGKGGNNSKSTILNKTMYLFE